MNKKIHIHLARSAGFCFGVKRAIRTAHELARKTSSVRMLGDLVHNETVIRELATAGIRTIKKLGRGKKRILLIRAHGVSRDVITRARRCGYRIVDATCPMVREIHRIVRQMDRRGARIIVIGDRQHDEVQGIIGQIRRRALVIDHLDHIPWPTIRRLRRAAIVVQSTQNMDRIMPIVKALQAAIPKVVFFNTICRPTRMKQEEIKILSLHNELMIVIGSRTSANTRRLYEIARALNPRTRWIQSADEINTRWLKQVHAIGITAGASTPQSTTQAVIAKIHRLTAT